MEKPKFKHDCKKCRFLGSYKEYDLYSCADYNSTTLISRFGDRGGDYHSLDIECSSSHEGFVEAKRRFKEKIK
jgi:hypothetical protein